MFKKTFVRVLAVGLALTAVFAIFAFSFRLFDRDETEDDPKESTSVESESVESEEPGSEPQESESESESETEYVPNYDENGVDLNYWELGKESYAYTDYMQPSTYLFMFVLEPGQTAEYDLKNGEEVVFTLGGGPITNNDSDFRVYYAVVTVPSSCFDFHDGAALIKGSVVDNLPWHDFPYYYLRHDVELPDDYSSFYSLTANEFDSMFRPSESDTMEPGYVQDW